MKSFAVSFVALAALASVNAFPVPNDDLNKWITNFLLNGQNLQVSLGWKTDGTVAAGARLLVNNEVPIGAVLSTNIKNMKGIQYEVGTGSTNIGTAAAVSGDMNGKLKYAINGIIPSTGKSMSTSYTLLGDHAEVKTVTVGSTSSVGTVTASVDLDRYVPQTVSLDFGKTT